MPDYAVGALLASLRRHIAEVRESNLVLRDALDNTLDAIDQSKQIIQHSDSLIARVSRYFSGPVQSGPVQSGPAAEKLDPEQALKARRRNVCLN